MTTLTQAVGMKGGAVAMPNQAPDVRAVTGLLDRIPGSKGGTADAPAKWSSDPAVLARQLGGAIAEFQRVNRRPRADGVLEPGDGTLQLMDTLAASRKVTATIELADVHSRSWVVADPSSVDGVGDVAPLTIAPPLTRRLVRVTGSSITWFGVVVPVKGSGGAVGGSPHVTFTPSPWQGGYQDGTYEQFDAWRRLFDKYTSAMGSQMVAAGVPQILVLPIYRNAQAGNLGEFLANWREVLEVVITAALNSVDPLFNRDTYRFDAIYSSSFSNGIATHRNFHLQGNGVSAMTRMAFDLDGQASGMMWRANRSVVYANTRVPGATNPVGNCWHVGGRLGLLRPSFPGSTDHNICPFLLMHGLSKFGR